MDNSPTNACGLDLKELKRMAGAGDGAANRHHLTDGPAHPDQAPPYPEAPAATDWPEPQPLPTALPTVDPFAPELLPTAFRPWIEDATARMQCPLDFTAVGAMVALATVVGRQIGIRPKRHDDWLVVPNLWGAVVGRPSVLKSPALKVPMDMLLRLEMAAKEDHERETREYEVHSLIAQAQVKKDKTELDKALKSSDQGNSKDKAKDIAGRIIDATEEAPPARRRYVTNDSTVEKLGELLAANLRGILVFRDELIGFLKNLDKEGREGSRSFYIEAWDGTGRFTFDRIGRGTVEIEAACVSLLGGIQPGPLQAHLRAALAGGAGDDGLIQRFQLLIWPDTPTSYKHVDRRPDTLACQQAWEVFKRLDAMDAAALGADREDGGIPGFRFDQAAQGVFDTWYEKHMQRIRAADMELALEAHLSKFVSLVPSLALLIHLADHPLGGLVGEEALMSACAWAQYLESHARRLYASVIAPEMAAATALDKRLPDLEDGFTVRDVYRHGWQNLNPGSTPGALTVLEDHCRIRGERKASRKGEGGRPTTVYQVNPALRRT